MITSGDKFAFGCISRTSALELKKGRALMDFRGRHGMTSVRTRLIDPSDGINLDVKPMITHSHLSLKLVWGA